MEAAFAQVRLKAEGTGIGRYPTPAVTVGSRKNKAVEDEPPPSARSDEGSATSW